MIKIYSSTPIITLFALITAQASFPTSRPSSAIALFVIEEVMILPFPISILTIPLTAPFSNSTILPLNT